MADPRTQAAPGSPEPDRWGLLWRYLPLGFVALPTVVSLGSGLRPEVLALAAVAAGWYGFMVLAHERWQGRLLPMAVYYAGLLAVCSALIRLEDAFFLLVLGSYVQAFVLLPGLWAYVGATATAAAVWLGSAPYGAADRWPSVLFGLALAFAVGGTVRAVTEQNERHRAVIAELEETGRKLAVLGEEKAELQAQLLRQAKESGVLAERQRMAREIHDTLAQGLIGIITHLEAAGHVLDDPARSGPRVATAQRLARDSLAEARRSVRALRPAPLAAAALPDALRKVTAQWSAASSVAAEVTVTGDARPLHPEVEVTLLRAAQESLANIARHAEARRAGLTLSYMEDVVALDVRDDGAGFDPADRAGPPAGAGGGFGLTAMRQRVTRLSGSLAVESAPGQGTAVSATVPAIPPPGPSPVPAAPAVRADG